MKKLIVSALIALYLGSCTGNRAVEMAYGIAFATASADTTVTIASTAGSPQCTISCSILYATGAGAAPRINRTLMSSAALAPILSDYTEDGRTNSTASRFGPKMARPIRAYIQTRLEEYRQMAAMYHCDTAHADSYGQHISVRTEVAEGADSIINYVVTTHMQTGEEADQAQTQVINLSARTGRQVALTDIVIEGAEEQLLHDIVTQMARQMGTEGLAGLRAKGIFVYEAPYVAPNFIVAHEGITFIYNIGEVAPVEIGDIRVTLHQKNIRKYANHREIL